MLWLLISDTLPTRKPNISFSTMMSEVTTTAGVTEIAELSGLSMRYVDMLPVTLPMRLPVTLPTRSAYRSLLRFQESLIAL